MRWEGREPLPDKAGESTLLSTSGGDKGLRGSGARKPRCSSLGRPVCQGTLWVASRLPSTVSNFKTERGTSLETPSRERASSCDGGGTTWFFSSCDAILNFRQGIQDASCVGPGKFNLPFEVRGRARDCSRVTAGQIDLIQACVQKLMFLSRGDRYLGVSFQTHPGSQASSRVEANNSALLSSLEVSHLKPTEWPQGSQASC